MRNFANKVLFTLIVLLIVLADSTFTLAQVVQDISKDEAELNLVERWYQAYEDIIESIEVSHGPASEGRAQKGSASALVRQTILTLHDAERGGRHGKVYLWTENERPVILSVIMSIRDKDVSGARVIAYEFNSLTQGTVTASRKEQRIWSCEHPGVEWKDGPTDLNVAGNRASRLIQMRSIARQYSAGVYKNETLSTEFRLMPQPIYRYPEQTEGAIDGAIFSYSIGTDPCIFLLLEARQDGWVVACARSHAYTVKVSKGSETIWSFNDQVNRNVFQTGSWYQKYTAERRAEDDPGNILYSAWGAP